MTEGSTKRRLRVRLAVALALFLLVPLLWLRSGAFQEPPRTLVQAVRLELRTADVLSVPSESEAWIVRSDDLQALYELLGERGWSYVEQMGAGHLFDHGGVTNLVVCRMYSTRFQICETPADPAAA